MSLFDDFQDEIKMYTKKPVGEVELFRAFARALKTNGVTSDECHGKCGIVNFDVTLFTPPINISCEISDLLLIFVHEKEIRYTFLQNKYTRSSSSTDSIAKVNSVQHYLLSKRPIFNPLHTKFPRDILHDAVLDGAGSYGNFYCDGSNFDMSYFVASYLHPVSKLTTKSFTSSKNRKYICTAPSYPSLILKNPYLETGHCDNLHQFENAYLNMKIGSPIHQNCSDYNFIINLCKFIINKATKNNEKNENLKGREIINSRIHKITNSLQHFNNVYNIEDEDGVFTNIADNTILFDCYKAPVEEIQIKKFLFEFTVNE